LGVNIIAVIALHFIEHQTAQLAFQPLKAKQADNDSQQAAEQADAARHSRIQRIKAGDER